MEQDKRNNKKHVEHQPDRLEVMRHSASHVLAQAVLRLYPDTKLGIGPAIDDGFYYDFEFAKDAKLTDEDLPKIEKEMKEIIKEDLPFQQIMKSREEAKKFLKGWGQKYKLDLLKDIPDEEVSFFLTGEGAFTDMCRGPHLESTGKIGAIKLLSIAGAYWRGDENKHMLTRIYGTAFFKKSQLKKHMEMLAEAEKRNHRKIGKEMELFTIFPEVGQGLPIWLPNGYTIRRELENYMFDLERKYGYVHCLTPHINKEELFKISGHLDFYKDSMYSPIEIDDEKYYLKPMNCPVGMLIYKMKTRSYRDLPYKLGEMGTVYRYEKSGELHGLQRVRGFTQNDAHIFCTLDQLEGQFIEVANMLKQFYADLGFTDYKFQIALSDPEAEKYKFCGSREDWKWAEDTLRKVVKEAIKGTNIEYYEEIGAAAFYGPKLDVQAVNVFGKEDTISTIQIDFNLAERFDLEYVDSNGEKQRPFVIHRALIGSFERFFAFLIEYYGGNFPLWLAPEQVRILTISDNQSEYAQSVCDELKNMKVRCSLNDRDETIRSKIRDAELARVPYILVVGDNEVENGTVSVRPKGGKNLGMIDLDRFEGMLLEEISSKGKVRIKPQDSLKQEVKVEQELDKDKE